MRMELFILIITLLILAETSFLVLQNRQKLSLGTHQRRKIYVDTSALMDPRLLPVAQTGFVGDDIFIPRSVTHELQLIADGKDSEKRARARAGLDTVRELERVVHFDTTILPDELDNTPVDNRLLALAKTNHGLILTNDYNLQKVAATEHIDVLNLNELALALRAQYLPGERARVKVVSVGSAPHQGIAYLSGGTMVVVDNASDKIGKEIDVEFIRLNQTASGSMMFARLASSKNTPSKTHGVTSKTTPIPAATSAPATSKSHQRHTGRAKPAKSSKPAKSDARPRRSRH